MSKKSQETHEQSADDDRQSLEEQIADLTAGWQRTQADFENFRRRTAEERSTLQQVTEFQTLLEVAPVLDNLRRALEHAQTNSGTLIDGLQHIERQLNGIFSAHELERIPTVGEPFNPQLHEAIGQQSSENPADTVIQEVESGYRSSDTILKPAKVIVSTGPAAHGDKQGKTKE